MLSTLHAGDQLIAVHLGMRSDGVLHTWFPAYNRAFAKYSPGMMLFVEMARAGSTLGIRRIDLGKGLERHKRSLMSGCFLVAEGAVDVRRVNRLLSRAMYQLRRRVGSSPLRRMARTPKRVIENWVAAWQMS